MAVNVKLLQRTLDKIKQNPDKWDQDSWRCDTGMCFAGWAAQLAGGTWLNRHPKGKWAEDLYLLAKKVDGADIQQHGEFKVVRASARAERVLGLDGHDADRLFSASNGLEDLESLVNEIIEREERIAAIEADESVALAAP